MCFNFIFRYFFFFEKNLQFFYNLKLFFQNVIMKCALVLRAMSSRQLFLLVYFLSHANYFNLLLIDSLVFNITMWFYKDRSPVSLKIGKIFKISLFKVLLFFIFISLCSTIRQLFMGTNICN